MTTQLRSYSQKLPGLFHAHEAYFMLICELAMLYAGYNLALTHFALFIGALYSNELFLSLSQAIIAVATIVGFTLLALMVGSVVLGGIAVGRRMWQHNISFRQALILVLLRLPLYIRLLSL
jgi:hypothetical protein